MEAFSSFAVGIVIPVMALIAKASLDKYFSRRMKEVVVRKENGRKETISIDANATNDQVLSEVASAMEFERVVEQAIKSIQSRSASMDFHQGSNVDFVVAFPDRKVAIEVKASADEVTTDQVAQYLSEEPNLERLILVSKKPFSTPVRERLEAAAARLGKVTFVTVQDNEKVESDLAAAIAGNGQLARP